MKILSSLLLFLFPMQFVSGQDSYADSLKQVVVSSPQDSSKLTGWALLSDYYSFLYPDSAMYYADTLIRYSAKNKNEYGEVLGYLAKGEAFDRVADYPSALQMAFNAMAKAKELKIHKAYLTSKASALLGHLNTLMGYYQEGRDFFNVSLESAKDVAGHEEDLYLTHFRIAFSYLMSGKMDSALLYADKGKAYLPAVKKLRNPTPWLIVGNIYKETNTDSAEQYFRQGLAISEEFNALFIRSILYNMLGVVYFDRKQMDSSIYYTQLSVELARRHNYKLFEIGSSEFLAFIYDQLKMPDSSLKYLKIMTAAKDEAFSQTKLRQFQLISSEDDKRQIEQEKERVRVQNRSRLYAFIGILFFFLVLSWVFWRNNKRKQIANRLLQSQNETIAHTLQELKSTQAQLIQSAKMASLGELTAGIAHEIQNPLNFVNNFSEINTELLGEMKEELSQGNARQAATLADNVFENEQKIIFHGKRAGAIVRGMLEHSRNSSGVKTLVNINELTEEYLRLAYHGLRAKDKLFNAGLETDFDPGAGTISIVSQEIGRVILNLITNAFYAVDEKMKKQGEEYKPTVSVATKRTGEKLEVHIRDNGNGISPEIKDKIFQPFFTTRPTGQGTGLGLSISYDIIKSHGGEIIVESKQGEGSEFIIVLPAYSINYLMPNI